MRSAGDDRGRHTSYTHGGHTQHQMPMRLHFTLLVSFVVGCASSPREDSTSLSRSVMADQGTFVVTLGRDTIAAERFRFGRARIDGEVVTRLRETVRRPYAMTFDAEGMPIRLEFSTRRPTDTPASPPLQTAVITLGGDTIDAGTVAPRAGAYAGSWLPKNTRG